MSKWIRKGDKVKVIAGNERGKTGAVLARHEDRVVIEGVNIRKRHLKKKTKVQVGIVESERPIHVSNVSLCDEKGSPIKLRVKLDGANGKELVYGTGDKEVVYRSMKTNKK